MSDVGSARRVRDLLKTRFGGDAFCVGIGVEREDGVGFVVRVSVRPGTSAEDRARIPSREGDVVVKVVETDA